MDAGEEVTICYDPAADYLDLFERYGFFDAQSQVHTVEVVAPEVALLAEGAEEWRRRLVEVQAERGYNAELCAWWIPEIRIEACPLFAAVRAAFVSQEELGCGREGPGAEGCAAGSPADLRLRSAICAEAEVRDRVARLIADHLAGYSTSLVQDAADLDRVQRHGGAWPQEAALRLLAFEKALLGRQLQALRGPLPPAAAG